MHRFGLQENAKGFSNVTNVGANQEIFKRSQYSLKLGLRMLNGRFEDTIIQQGNASSINLEQKYKDKTIVECWYMAKTQEEVDSLLRTQNFPQVDKDHPKLMTVGTIVD